MAYVDRTLTQAEAAQRCIIEAAPGCIARMTPGSPNRRTAEALLASAHRESIRGVAAQHRPALASYAATMQRQPPSPRTIVRLLHLVQAPDHTPDASKAPQRSTRMDPSDIRTETELDAMKPSQQDLDTAARVLWWMEAHARLFPDEYGEAMGISQKPVDVLVAAANACDVDVEMLITTQAEQRQRDADNRQATEPLNPRSTKETL